MPDEIADPTTYQWGVAAIAAALVVAMGTALFVRVVGRGRDAAVPRARRFAGAALAALGLGALLGTVVVIAAGVRASGLGPPAAFGEPPLVTERFAARIIDVDPDVTEDIARYATALVAPVGLLLLAVALAVLRLGTTGARVVGGATSGLCLVVVGVALVGDGGALVSGLAWAAGAVAALGVVGLIADELTALGAPRNVRAVVAVRVVRIDQPAVRNAVNAATATRLHDEFLAFEADPDERVAVLTGDAQAFSAGANLRDLPTLRPSGPLGPTRLQLSKPVIAAVEGWCVAGGLELAIWCDLRVAGESAVFGCLERRWGVPLIDGGTYRLPRLVGLGRALDMILTGREVGTDEAHAIGLVDRVVPDGSALDAAVELAETIAAFPWRCVVSDRACVYEGLGLGVDAALANEDVRGREVIFAEGFADGVSRFTDRAR